MNERTQIHGIWWWRDETLDQTIECVVATFNRLAGLTLLWSPWYRSYHSFADCDRAAVKLTNNPELIRKEFEFQREEYKVSAQYGYFLRAFAGPEKGKRMEKSEFYVSSCHLPPNSGYNNVRIELPTLGPQAEELRKTDLLASAVSVLIDIWNPDSMMVGDMMKVMVERPWPNGPFLGWINYLSRRVASVSELPEGWQWWGGAKDRQIFIHEGGMPSPDNPDHMAAFAGLSKNIRWELHPEGIVAKPITKSYGGGEGMQSKDSPQGPRRLKLKFAPTPENAVHYANQIIKAAKALDGIDLDFSVASLKQVDQLIEKLRVEGASVEQVGETLVCFGCYVGEVFVKNARGKWKEVVGTATGELAGFPLVIELENGNWCNPIGRVFKRLAIGSTEELVYFYHVFAEGT